MIFCFDTADQRLPELTAQRLLNDSLHWQSESRTDETEICLRPDVNDAFSLLTKKKNLYAKL